MRFTLTLMLCSVAMATPTTVSASAGSVLEGLEAAPMSPSSQSDFGSPPSIDLILASGDSVIAAVAPSGREVFAIYGLTSGALPEPQLPHTPSVPIPEPSTFSLVGLALTVGTWFLRRSLSRKHSGEQLATSAAIPSRDVTRGSEQTD